MFKAHMQGNSNRRKKNQNLQSFYQSDLPLRHTTLKTDRQSVRQKVRETDRQTVSQSVRQTDRLTVSRSVSQTDRQTD